MKCAIGFCGQDAADKARLCMDHGEEWELSEEAVRLTIIETANEHDRARATFMDFIRRTEAEHRNGAK
ncbi:MAG: hypothetical protein ACK4N5_05335 [Myxococcales bacterium]